MFMRFDKLRAELQARRTHCGCDAGITFLDS